MRPWKSWCAASRADDSQFQARLLAAPAEFDHEPCLRLLLHPLDQPATLPLAPTAAPANLAVPDLSQLLAEIAAHLDVSHHVQRPFAIFYLRLKTEAQARLRELGLTQNLAKRETWAQRTLAAIQAEHGFGARLHDDGFGIIIDGITETEAQAIATRLLNAAQLPGSAGAPPLAEATSDSEIGYYLVQDRAGAAEDILNAAHRLCLYTASSSTPRSSAGAPLLADADARIVQRVERALAQDHFKLVYQPIISLMGDDQENYSVMVQLADEHEPPLEMWDFIASATQAGLIEEVEKWAIRAAIQVISEQRRAGQRLSLFISLSEDTFRNPSVVLWICDCLREFDVRGNWLTFQFQEEAVTPNLATLSKLVETLKKIKCRVAVNRFGGLPQPELVLQSLPLDYVLLKSSFAQGLADDPAKQQRLVTLATLAHESNVKTVVTGVEDARSLTVLWTAGVDYVQGNFLQRPSATLETVGI